MSAIYYEMYQRIRWIDGWIEGWIKRQISNKANTLKCLKKKIKKKVVYDFKKKLGKLGIYPLQFCKNLAILCPNYV